MQLAGQLRFSPGRKQVRRAPIGSSPVQENEHRISSGDETITTCVVRYRPQTARSSDLNGDTGVTTVQRWVEVRAGLNLLEVSIYSELKL